jgi:hypothetical protein
MGIQLFNSLPLETTILSYDIRLFNEALKKFLYSHAFCSLQEYFYSRKYN